MESVLVKLHTDKIREKSFMGGAVQWDPHEWYDLSEAEWKRLLSRIDYMKPGFIRCMLRSYWYCNGFDKDGNPVYTWENRRMQKLYSILEHCRRNDIDVILGDWHAPAFEGETETGSNHLGRYQIKTDDIRWSRILGELLDYLLNRRGLSCIKYFTLCNEPNHSESVDGFSTWARGIKNLAGELKKRKLESRIRLCGPDTFLKDGEDWLQPTMDHLTKEICTYETHWYPDSHQVRRGVVEETLLKIKGQISKKHSDRRFFLGEAGLSDGIKEGEKQSNIRKYWYGVAMADYFIQCLRAGISGVSAWILDDSMHLNGNSNPEKYDLKVWGFWNSIGRRMGIAEDENIRPWYYAWSLLSRYFPRGSQILFTENSGIDGLRLSAAKVYSGAIEDISIAIVNNSDNKRSVTITADCINVPLPFKKFVYSEEDRPSDNGGFPVVKESIASIDMVKGIECCLPANSVVIFTTMSR